MCEVTHRGRASQAKMESARANEARREAAKAADHQRRREICQQEVDEMGHHS